VFDRGYLQGESVAEEQGVPGCEKLLVEKKLRGEESSWAKKAPGRKRLLGEKGF
jgi:hypothetical protein